MAKCKTCKGTEFLSIRSVGLVCSTCNPQTKSGLQKFIDLHDIKLKIIDSPETIGRSLKVGLQCLDCSTIFTASTRQVQDYQSSELKVCISCRTKSKISKMAATLRSRHKSGELVPKTRFTSESYESELKARKLKPLEDYKGMNTSVVHECLICSHEFKNSPGNIIHQNCGCGVCTGNIKKDHNTYLMELENVTTIFEPIEPYGGARRSIKHRCIECGFIKSMMPTNVLKGGTSANYCPKHSAKSGFKRKTMRLGNREIAYQGYNNFGIEYLTSVLKVKPKDIVTEYENGIPRIDYRYKGFKRHYPDLFVAPRNLLVEVKSPYTLGLEKRSRDSTKWYMQCAKARGAIKSGYNYTLLVFKDTGASITIPDDWYDYSFREIISYISTSSPS